MSKRSREEVIEEHSMGESLEKYIELKVNDKIYDKDIQKIIVRGKYIRDDKQIKKEKNKRFNYKRPTIEINGNVAYLNCYPGIDYIFHYGNIIKTALDIRGVEKEVIVENIGYEDILKQLEKENLKDIPKVDTVFLGYVEQLESLSDDKIWYGNR